MFQTLPLSTGDRHVNYRANFLSCSDILSGISSGILLGTIRIFSHDFWHCVESTSNKSFLWAPTTELEHKTGNVQRVQIFGELGRCCEKCGSMVCFASDFPTFLFHLNAATTFSERRLQIVQSLVCTYILRNSFNCMW